MLKAYRQAIKNKKHFGLSRWFIWWGHKYFMNHILKSLKTSFNMVREIICQECSLLHKYVFCWLLHLKSYTNPDNLIAVLTSMCELSYWSMAQTWEDYHIQPEWEHKLRLCQQFKSPYKGFFFCTTLSSTEWETGDTDILHSKVKWNLIKDQNWLFN